MSSNCADALFKRSLFHREQKLVVNRSFNTLVEHPSINTRTTYITRVYREDMIHLSRMMDILFWFGYRFPFAENVCLSGNVYFSLLTTGSVFLKSYLGSVNRKIQPFSSVKAESCQIFPFTLPKKTCQFFTIQVVVQEMLSVVRCQAYPSFMSCK